MATKTAVFQIRLTEEEKHIIQANAESLGLSMGRYLVMLAIQDKQSRPRAKRINFLKVGTELVNSSVPFFITK